MSRKIILNLATSIDGYIASEDGGYDWIVEGDDNSLDTNKNFEQEDFFTKFLERIDIVVMGKKCYDQGFYKDFKDKKVYVATNEKLDNYENIHFISGDICSIIEDEKSKMGKDIYLFGGGVVIDNFIKKDIIDEYIIGIIPTILGNGRPLFLDNNPKIDLKLKDYIVDKGTVILIYERKNTNK